MKLLCYLRRAKWAYALLAVSVLFTFSCKSQNEELRFAVLTDLHVVPGNDNERHLEDAVKSINESGYEFVIVDGDLSNMGSDEELQVVKNILDKLTVPAYITSGNHETNWSESAGLTFNKLFGSDRFIFEAGNYVFVGYPTGPYMKMSDGSVKKEDIIWIDEQLAERGKSGKKIISIGHYPLGDGLSNWKDVVDVLKKHDAKLHINGHHHTLEVLTYDSIPGIMAKSLTINKPGDAIYNEVIFTGDSVTLNTRSKAEGWQIKHFKTFAWDEENIGREFPKKEYNNPQENEAIAFSYYEPATIFTGVAFSAGDKAGRIIYYGTSTGDLKALDINTKETLWKVETGNTVYATPFVSENTVVFGHTDGKVAGYDALTGSEKWNFTFSAPVLQEGTVDAGGFAYLGSGSGEFAKFDTQSGEIIWKNKPANGLIQGKPVISADGKKVIFGAWDTNLYCLSTETGETLWKWTNGKTVELYSPGNIVPVIAGQTVFIVAPDRYFTAIDLETGKQLYRTNQHTVRESLCLSKDGKRVYAKTMQDVLICVSATARDKYTLLWEANLGYGYEHTPCPPMEAEGGLVFCTNRRGQVFAVEGETGAAKWAFDAGNSAANRIVESPDKRVFITLVEGRILSVDQKKI